MNTELDRVGLRILVALLPFQTACVSLQHQPDPATLTHSANCEAINGSYVTGSAADGRVLADSLFDIDGVVS